MNLSPKSFIYTIVMILIFSTDNFTCAGEPAYAEIIKNIAVEISALRETFPQLADFSPDDHLDVDSLRISYQYRTHEPTHRGGWTSGVPHPDPDGVWFHIDFHDPESTAQIHTQPMVEKGIVGNKVVMFLILEGGETKSMSGTIWGILKNNGVSMKE